MTEMIPYLSTLPALFFLFKISLNTGKMVEKIESQERRINNIEKKVFFR